MKSIASQAFSRSRLNLSVSIAAVALLAPELALANPNCVESMSRVPMASAIPVGGGAPMRANMLRSGARPKAAPVARAKLAKAKVAAVKKSGVRKAALHRAKPKAAMSPTRVAALGLPPIAKGRPTPVPLAAANMARPTPTFALIGTTVCENGPVIAAPIIADAGPPRLAMLMPTTPGGGFTPGGTPPIGGTFFPPIAPPGGDGPDVFVPPTEPGGPDPEPPIVTPPVVVPPVVVPPVVVPPVIPPVKPEPPVTPPVTPPVDPPTPVPEPGTWALMIVGFGAVGATLRRRQRMLNAGGATRSL